MAFKVRPPYFKYLSLLFPKFFVEQDISSLQCEVCEFAIHDRNYFPIQSYKPSKLFSMIHSDVWRPNQTSILSNKKWFITFMDDHTRLCWIYLVKEKSEVGQIIKKNCKLVQTQFNTQIQVFRIDNGTEFFNKIEGNVFLENRIVHQSSCVNSPQ